MLFGTDFTGYEPDVFIARIKLAIKDMNAREAVFSRNITGLLAKIGSRPIG